MSDCVLDSESIGPLCCTPQRSTKQWNNTKWFCLSYLAAWFCCLCSLLLCVDLGIILCPCAWRTPSSDPYKNGSVGNRFLALYLTMFSYHLCFWSMAMLEYLHLSSLSSFSAWGMCPPPPPPPRHHIWWATSSYWGVPCGRRHFSGTPLFFLLTVWPQCVDVRVWHLWWLLAVYINVSHQAWRVWGYCFFKPAPCLFLAFPCSVPVVHMLTDTLITS